MSTRIQQSNISSGTNKQTAIASTSTGVVVDVILDETHPRIKNKKDFQDLIRQDVFDLRFKQINYKWSEHDNSYTSYTLNTTDEGKIF
jgi:hypothetical protein